MGRFLKTAEVLQVKGLAENPNISSKSENKEEEEEEEREDGGEEDEEEVSLLLVMSDKREAGLFYIYR